MAIKSLEIRVYGILYLFMAGAVLTAALAQPVSAQWADAADDDVDTPITETDEESSVTPDESEGTVGDGPAQDAAITQLLTSYLHFALIGRFDVADKQYAETLLARAELNPLSDEAAEILADYTATHQQAIETLILLVNNEQIGANAQRILGLVREAHRRQRMKPGGIIANLKLLAGDPMQQSVGLDRLIESGEYAVPWMLQAMADPNQQYLYPYLLSALPKLGRNALNPLIAALPMRNTVLRLAIIETLGKIGYLQAVPYLQLIATDEQEDAAFRKAAVSAIDRIAGDRIEVKKAPAVKLINDLAEQYYHEADIVSPDPREERVNVWVFREQADPRDEPVTPIEVPRGIYGMVMCMQCCEASLRYAADQPMTLALWLAANFRREARLGMDVELEDLDELAALDNTRPDGFLRSIYYARIAGPRYNQIALRRGLEDKDRDVALGAVAALNATTGPVAIVEPLDKQGMSLAEALWFPDVEVRVKAALALGKMAPRVEFHGAGEVVPTLATALTLTGNRYYLVVDPQAETRESIQRDLAATGATVLVAEQWTSALGQVREQLSHLDGIFVSTDLNRPKVMEAVQQVSGDPRFGLAPVVLIVKPGGTEAANRVIEMDRRVGSVLMLAADGKPEPDFAELLVRERDKVAARYGYTELSPETGLDLALKAAKVLYDLALTQRQHVCDVMVAQRALLAVLTHPTEELREASIEVLALLSSAEAQRGIARAALDSESGEELRIKACAALADSARRFGPLLDAPAFDAVLHIALQDESVALRTAASKAVGAMNLPGPQAAEIILNAGR
ncbi:MAG: hypothetical protein GXY44_09015 [Phycisphaerales bacterium]|nr:hypothetical protein [Phycisphaerales bacterium]